jgi:hypothetical protein
LIIELRARAFGGPRWVRAGFATRLEAGGLFHSSAGETGICGFPAFYDCCYYTALVQLLSKHGFDVEDHHVSYYQSRYYHFFLPLYCASVCYESMARATGMANLGAYILIVARRRQRDCDVATYEGRSTSVIPSRSAAGSNGYTEFLMVPSTGCGRSAESRCRAYRASK